MRSIFALAMVALLTTVFAPVSEAGPFGRRGACDGYDSCGSSCGAPVESCGSTGGGLRARLAAKRKPACCPAPAPCCEPAPAPAPCCEPAPAPAPAPCCQPAPAPAPAPCCEPAPAPACCPAPAPCCESKPKCKLFSRLGKKDACCEPACEPACPPKKCGLLSKLGSRLGKKDACCEPACEPACGCN